MIEPLFRSGREPRDEEPELKEAPNVITIPVPGIVSAVTSVPGGISLFGLDEQRIVRSTYYDPRLQNAEWVEWFPIHPGPKFTYWNAGTNSAGTGGGSGSISIGNPAAISSIPGGISLFATDVDGVVVSTYYDPRGPHPRWVEWFPIRPEKSFPSAFQGQRVIWSRITAVSSIPGGISLFAADLDGVIWSTYYDPRVQNPEWVEWFPIHPEQKFGPNAAVSAVSSVPGGVSLFALNSSGVVMSTYYDPRVQNPEWVPWFPIHPEKSFRQTMLDVVAVSSVSGGVSLFVCDGYTVFSTYYDPRVPHPEWVPWFPIHPEQEVWSALSAVSSVPGGISLFAQDGQGNAISTYYDPLVQNSEWVRWFPIHPEQDVIAPWNSWPPVTAVSSIRGGISLFTLGKDRSVWSTYYDPRVPHPEWVPWFPIRPEQTFDYFLRIAYA